MPGVVRIPRIGLLGAECSGKSSLAHALGAALPGCVVQEELRRVVGELGRPPHAWEQAAILQRQAALEEERAANCTLPWLIADPAPLMTAVYSVEYFADEGLLAEGFAHARGYDLLIWCAPDVPWASDGIMRDGPARRSSTEECIARILHAADAASLPPVIRVTGDVAERVRRVTSAVGSAQADP